MRIGYSTPASRAVTSQKIGRAWNAEGDPFGCQTWPKDLVAITPPFEFR
jgi:hypothetical protein